MNNIIKIISCTVLIKNKDLIYDFIHAFKKLKTLTSKFKV